MQKNVPKYTPAVGAARCRCGRRRSQARGRPTRCATTAARCCGSPTSGRSSTTRRWSGPASWTTRPTSCSTSTRRTADAFRLAVRRRPAGPPGAGRRRAGGRGQDQRRQGRARVRADRRQAHASRTSAAATRAIAARAERLDPALATTAFIREDRGGKVFLDSTRAGGATVVGGLQPAGPARRAGVVPGGLGRPRPASRRPTSPCTPRPRLLGGRRPVGRARCPRRSGCAADLVEEGRTIPVARVQAMHEGKRRARARRSPDDRGGQRLARCIVCAPAYTMHRAHAGHRLPAMSPRAEAHPAEHQQGDPQPRTEPEPEAEPRPGPERSQAVPGDGHHRDDQHDREHPRP